VDESKEGLWYYIMNIETKFDYEIVKKNTKTIRKYLGFTF